MIDKNISDSTGTGKGAVASGVLLLSISGILVKVVGLLFKVPLTNLIGEGGMGYFNSAYTIYTFFYILSTAGLPVALSIMVSGARAKGNYRLCAVIFRLALTVFCILGALFSFLMLIASGRLAELISNPGAVYAVAAMAPTLLFVCVISAYRGYFQGCLYMLPTAVSQIIEALGKLAFGMGFAVFSVRLGCTPEISAACAVLGITVSSAFSMLYLIISKSLIKRFRSGAGEHTRRRTDYGVLLKKLVKTALPITVSSAVISLSGLLDLAVVMRRLTQIGYSGELANSLYGAYTSMAVPLFNMPSVLITPITAAAVPYIAGAVAKSDMSGAQSAVKNAFRYATIIGMPASLGMAVLAEPILKLLFRDTAAVATAPLLSILAFAIIFVAYSNISMSLMQAAGIMKVPIVSMVIGSAVKLIFAWVLIGRIGMSGTPVSTLLCYITITVINLSVIEGKMNVRTGISKIIILPALAAVICSAAAYAVCGLLESLWLPAACILAVASAAAVYIALLLLTGYIKTEEISRLPVINRLPGKKAKTPE